ncbi:MAG: hypothetical protein R3C68_07510 [Myxococcota bacterium]
MLNAWQAPKKNSVSALEISPKMLIRLGDNAGYGASLLVAENRFAGADEFVATQIDKGCDINQSQKNSGARAYTADVSTC